MHPDKLAKLIRAEVRTELQRFDQRRQAVFARHPLVLGALVTIGGSATFTGLGKILNEVDWLNQNPWILVVFGLALLIFTGALYKQLR